MHTRHWLFKPILLFVSIGSFLISWIFTCNLLASMATSGFATVIAFGLATVLEPAKIVFHAVGVINRDLFSLIVGIVLTLMSIVGTLGWLQVQHAEKVELATHNSVGFLGLQSQISALDTQIANLQGTANSLPSNYYTRRQELVQNVNTLLDQKNELTQQLSNYKPSTGMASSALFIALGKFFNGTDPQLIELWVNATYGILLELVAVISGIYVFKGSGRRNFQTSAEQRNFHEAERSSNTAQVTAKGNPKLNGNKIKGNGKFDHFYLRQNYDDSEKEVVPQKRFRTSSTRRIRQEDSESDEFEEEEDEMIDVFPVLSGYIEGLFSKVGKGGRLQGRRSVADKIGISKGLGDRCHNYLKKEGLVNVRGNATFASVPKSKMLDYIQVDVGRR